MKRNLNTSYRLVWNDVLGAFVAVSELAKAKGKRTGAVLAVTVIGLAGSAAALADGSSITVSEGESVTGVVVSNHDSHLVYGQAAGSIINTGQEYGDDDENNQGGQFIQSGGVATSSVVNASGLEAVLKGGSATDTIVNSGGGQSVHGEATDTVLNGGSQWVHDGGVANGTVINESGYQLVKAGATASGTVVNTGSQGGPDAENSDGQFVSGDVTDTLINANGRQVIFEGGSADTTTVKMGGDQSVHGVAKNTLLEGGFQYVHEGASAEGTVISQNGWQVVKNGATATDTTILNGTGTEAANGNSASSQNVQAGGSALNTTIGDDSPSGELLTDLSYQMVNGGRAENTTINNGGVQSVFAGGAAIGSVVNRGGRLEVSIWQDEPVAGKTAMAGSANNVTVEADGVLSVDAGTSATDVVIKQGGALWATTDSTVTGTNSLGDFSIDGTTHTATNVLLENGGKLSVLSNGIAESTTVNNGGVLAVAAGGTASDIVMNDGGTLIADSGANILGNTTLKDNAVLAGDVTNNDTLLFSTGSGAEARFTGTLSGEGSLLKEGEGTLTVSDSTVTQSQLTLNGGTLALENSVVNSDVIAQSGTSLLLTGNTVLNGAIDPTDVTLDSGAIWNIPDNATVKSVLDDLSASGTINFTSVSGSFTPNTLTVKNLIGHGGSINMSVRLDDPTFPTDMLIIDGGTATGKTWLNFTNVGNAGLGLATTGNGIKVVDAINGATTEAGAFALGRKLQAGAYNYTLQHGTADENWYLTSEAAYRAETALYASLFAQTLDYDRVLAGSYSQRSNNAQRGSDNAVWGRIQGGHLGHGDRKGLAQGTTPESSGSYGFMQLGGDLLRTDVLTAGVYGALGESNNEVKNDDRSRAGSVRDHAYSLGGYLTAVDRGTGLWADMVAQGSRHSLEATSADNRFDTRGWSWLGSLESGLPLNIGHSLVLEPQVQYVYQSTSLDNGHDNGGYVNFGIGSAQHVRAGLRLGNQSEMAFDQGTSTLAGYESTMKHSAAELPVNWWITPSVIRTFGNDGDLNMGTTTAGSNVTFSPSQNGTALDVQAGVEAQIRQNVTLGVQGGYTRSVSGNSAGGYNGQASLKVAF
ncbi:AIDA repeat-containing protein [Enterobacter hormaechei]|uniref:AIDA repeat-containing protein n=1 Tax=Enterobacteriaceae TaxID=543 RepID=UPI000FDB161D|nr:MULTISPECIES: AIDA repeat-containing protein [Enterobacteriaceae]ELQ3561699.1 AIDA repeat-containing protein [Enterobacter hormaechei]HCB1638262.1 AIDA repeat-containing protein [Citrobacter freundii]EMB8466171.1 AIDA repeat-containing protein [Enterobacter hormaechei]MCL8192464.1 AIDA repeat-containing protein [Enterobacter cloacae]MCM8140100.1 AIDA repeat-containing protein [Enterobacter cloacae]